MLLKTQNRVAFGKPLAAQGTIQADVAMSRIEIEQARLLVLKAAHVMDHGGNKVSYDNKSYTVDLLFFSPMCVKFQKLFPDGKNYFLNGVSTVVENTTPKYIGLNAWSYFNVDIRILKPVDCMAFKTSFFHFSMIQRIAIRQYGRH